MPSGSSQSPRCCGSTSCTTGSFWLRSSLAAYEIVIPASRPASPGKQRVDMGVEVPPAPEGLDHRHNPGPKALLLHGRRHESWCGSRTQGAI